jgi:RNA polymerase sigma-70 factor (ECF subfamily)
MPRHDAELLAQASRGDHAAFATLYRKYERDLYRFAFYLAGEPDAADELFQETWLRVVKHLGRKQVEDFKKWVFTIATNLFRDELRKRKVRRLVLGRESVEEVHGDPDEEQRPVAIAEVPADADGYAIREALAKAMKKLTDKQRTVFALMYIEGFKIHEVGEMLRKPEGTIKSTLHRTLVILRSEMKEFRG